MLRAIYLRLVHLPVIGVTVQTLRALGRLRLDRQRMTDVANRQDGIQAALVGLQAADRRHEKLLLEIKQRLDALEGSQGGAPRNE